MVRRHDKHIYTYIYKSMYILHPIYYPLALRFPLSLLGVTQIRSHIAGSSPSLLGFVACYFIARIFQLVYPSLTCVELCLSTPGAISNF